MKTEIEKKYPITFIDYSIIVPSPGIIIFDHEMKADQLCVKDGDKFEVVINDGRISMFKIETEQGLLKKLDEIKTGIQGIW
jgi:ArsR family metal-binding transcriptional regulator